MERIQSINPERITWCCRDYGITPEILSEEADIPSSTLDGALDGRSGLTFGQLQRVAKYFNRGVLFFLEQGPVQETRVRSPQFRTIANARTDLTPELKRIIEQAERHRDIYVSLLEDLDDDEAPRFDPPRLPVSDPRRAAAIVRKWLGLGEENDFSSFRASVESRGILVFRSMGYLGPWRFPEESPVIGFSLYHETCPVIMVRKQRSESRQSFTMMHELGHILLHRTSVMDDEDVVFSVSHGTRSTREQEANAFAGCLLVPDEWLSRIPVSAMPDNVSEYREWLRPFSSRWGVGSELILRRLVDSGLIRRQAYRNYRQWQASLPRSSQDHGSRQYRHREPIHVFGQSFVRTVLGALSARKISLRNASAYLDNLKVPDIHMLEAHLADN